MNVLSLFDGISCGQLALKRAGIPYDAYYASEIDKYAIQITQNYFPDTQQLGDVRNIKTDTLPPITLLIGGSPCTGFSLVGKMLNFEDPQSKLFFEYVRILNECKPQYFLLENVVMKKEWSDIITEHMMVPPIEINSSIFSAQNRPRLYWTNIPVASLPSDKGLVLKDIIDFECKDYQLSEEAWGYMKRSSEKWTGGKQRIEVYDNKLNKKAKCLTANMWKGVPYGVVSELNRRLSPLECERLQTIDDNYTSIASDTQRYKMLGNCWTIDVIAHIFKGIGKEPLRRKITVQEAFI